MKHIVYVLTLAFVMMASTALAQTESQLCDQIIIDGKTYPATSLTQKDDATVFSFGDIVTATISVVHPQDKKTINFADEKGLYSFFKSFSFLSVCHIKRFKYLNK